MSNIDGFKQFADKLNKLSKDFQQEVKEITEYNLGEIELQAIRDAPGGGDQIRTQLGSESQSDIARGRSWTPISQAIGYSIDSSGYKGTVYVERSAGEIAAWVEFGTGQSASSYLATVPPEWKSLAQLYYINGKGTIIAQPYLLPAFLKYKIEYVKELKAALNKLSF